MERETNVFCVDDTPHVADALRIKLSRTTGFKWQGWAADADALLSMSKKCCASIVILDLDMPGRDAFAATEELLAICPDSRVVVFSGHVRKDLIDKAVKAGVWGYVAKSDGEDALVEALCKVVDGEFAFSPEVRATYDQ